MSGIVVGHDGSKNAQAAVEKALRVAAAMGEDVVVVRVFGLRQSDWPDDLPFGSVPTIDELEAYTRRRLEADLAPLLSSHPDVTVELKVVEGKPARVLVEASKDASLLVVANRGLGGFDRLLLGSVSEQLVQHAQCDVLVTRVK
ncbi:hypothetical protein GCM10027418_08410 [Mariniluteicoccus endophyticus]